jgi:hypothetical protein
MREEMSSSFSVRIERWVLRPALVRYIITGKMAVASTNVTQHTTVGPDAEALSRFVAMLVTELPALRLGDKEEAARQALAEAENALKGSAPERSRVAEALGSFASYVAAAGIRVGYPDLSN